MSTNAPMHSNLYQFVLWAFGKVVRAWQCFFPCSHVTAKTRNNYMPRFVFYRKKRLLFTKKPFFIIKNENAHPWCAEHHRAAVERIINALPL
jgi:hypothetical protein